MSKKDKIKNIDMDDLKALPDVLDGRHHVIQENMHLTILIGLDRS